MSPIHKLLRRSRAALLGAALIAGCSSGGTDNNNPGTIALGLNPTTATIPQGGQATVAATLTRGGGFTGNVNLTVTGAPTGVTATVSNVVTTGTTTTATVTVQVAASTATGLYSLVVHGTGTGVTEATATYGLTVAPLPAVAVALSASTLTIVQGAATPTTTVTLTRTNFTGDVTLAVDNLPTGVTASFAPANPQSGNSSVLTLTVAPTALAGTFNTLAVRATGVGITAATAPLTLTVTAPAPDYQLSLSLAALSIVQGANAPTTVNIARTNFPGAVTLTLTGGQLPEGVTVTFNPTSPTTANSTVATIAVDAGVPPGVYNVAIDGAGTPGNRTTPLVLTVTAGVPPGNFNLTTTPPTSVNVTQGGAGVPVTVNINHTGGNISIVTLSMTSGTLPAGLSIGSFSINPTGQPSSTFTVTATAGVPVGAYPIVIHGNVLNLAEQTVNLTINVVAPSGSGNVTVDFSGCTAATTAVWAAFQNGGLNTPWTVVTPTAGIYSFTINAGQGGFTFVTVNGGSSEVTVQYMTQTEMTAGPLRFCGSTPSGRTITGSITGMNTGDLAQVSWGNAFGFAAAALPNYTLNNAPPLSTHDLVMYTHPGAVVAASDRMGLFRDQTPTTVFNTFNIATDPGSFPPLVQLITIAGAHIGETFTHGMNYYTGGSCDVASLYNGMTVTGNSFNAYGAQVAQQRPTDRHGLLITGNDSDEDFRSVWETFHDLTAHTVTLPASLPGSTVNDIGTAYSILRNVFTAPADYNLSFGWQVTQSSAPRGSLVLASRGYFPAAGIELRIGQYAGLVGWQDSWAPAHNSPATTVLTASGGTAQGTFCTVPNGRFVFASSVSDF